MSVDKNLSYGSPILLPKYAQTVLTSTHVVEMQYENQRVFM